MGEKILLLGDTGMLGQAMGQRLTDAGYTVRGAARTGRDYRLNLCSDTDLIRCIHAEQPDIIINAAANVGIDECERDSDGAFRINGRLPGILAELCRESGAYLVQVSTDHYYRGDGAKKHRETDPVRLINEYGRSKYVGESLALTYPHALVLRTNIVGFRGDAHRNTFLEWAVSRLEQRSHIVLFSDFYTSSMRTVDFAETLVHLLPLRPTGVFNLASREVSSKEQFVRALSLALFGREPDYTPGSVRDMPGTVRGDSLGLDVTKAEVILGYALPTLAETIAGIKTEYEHRRT